LAEKLKGSELRPMALGQMDGPFKVNCEAGHELARKEGSYAAPMLAMLNGAIEKAIAAGKDPHVITFGYWNTLTLPKTMRPHKNLWIQIVSSDYSLNQAGDHLGRIRDNPANRGYERSLREWPRVSDKITTWHWATGSGGYEWPNLFTHIDNIRLWQEYGIDGAQEQTASGVSASNWSELKFWVWHRLKWDPKRDAEALIKRFLREYYGDKAAPILWAYHQAAEEIRAESGYFAPGGLVRWIAWPINMRRKFLHLQSAETLDGLLEEAQRAAQTEDNPAFAKHVAEARSRATDSVMIDAVREAEGFGRVADPASGEPYFVPGGREDMPARVRRARPEERQARDWFGQRAGGRIYEVHAGDLRADVVPAFRGHVTSLVHEPTGTELLAGWGYGHNTHTRNQLVSLETERWRYIEAPTPELYDLHEDPDELDNLHDRRPAVAGAQRLESEGRLAEARTLLQELAREDPANPDVHFALASVHFKSQDWHEAIDVNRGNILLETGRLEEARQAFLAAQTAAAQGRLEVARRWAREAAERSPDDPRVRQLLERLGVGGRRAADGPTGRGGGRPDR